MKISVNHEIKTVYIWCKKDEEVQSMDMLDFKKYSKVYMISGRMQIHKQILKMFKAQKKK